MSARVMSGCVMSPFQMPAVWPSLAVVGPHSYDSGNIDREELFSDG